MRILIVIKAIVLIVMTFSMGSCSHKGEVKSESQNIDSLFVLFPDSVPILVKHGNKMLQEYNYEQAMADGAKAFRLDSNNLDARLLYADVLNNRPLRTVADVVLAQQHFKIIHKKEPKNLKGLIGLASTYSQQQDFDNSFRYINEALRIDKKYRDAYILKGSNYLSFGNVEKAKSSYETAIQQDPEFFEAYLALGLLYQADSNEISIEYLTTAHNLKPKNMEIIYTLAYAKQQFRRFEEAKNLYRKMAADTSDYYVSQALFQQGFIKQFEEGQLDSAIYFYKSALKTEPMYVEAWHNLGLCYVDNGEVSMALKAFSSALKYNPEFELSRKEAAKLKHVKL
jgi:tetratricopeptide (TPR) repeat protein